MRLEFIRSLASLAATVTLAACTHVVPASAPPPPPPTSASAVAASEPAPASPASKCESLEEACVAAAHTRTTVGRSGWTIAPPGGWKFAQKEDATIAASAGATIAVTTYDRLSKSRSRDVVFREIAGGLGVDLAGREVLFPKRPHKRRPVGDVVVSLYELGRFFAPSSRSILRWYRAPRSSLRAP